MTSVPLNLETVRPRIGHAGLLVGEDLLSPRLMSGEIRVAEAEKIVEGGV